MRDIGRKVNYTEEEDLLMLRYSITLENLKMAKQTVTELTTRQMETSIQAIGEMREEKEKLPTQMELYIKERGN